MSINCDSVFVWSASGFILRTVMATSPFPFANLGPTTTYKQHFSTVPPSHLHHSNDNMSVNCDSITDRTASECSSLFMVALWNRETIYIFMLWFVLLLSSFFYSSPNLSRHRLDVCHTSTHGVALVRI